MFESNKSTDYIMLNVFSRLSSINVNEIYSMPKLNTFRTSILLCTFYIIESSF